MRDQLSELGSRLRQLRKERKLTLQELAAATNLSTGLISKIENFRTLPSLPVLITLAGALRTELSELFAGMNFHLNDRYLVVRRADQKTVEREERPGMQYRVILERPLSAASLQLMFVTVDPGPERDAVVSEGDEILYILSGRIEFKLDGEPVLLEAGDTLFFDGRIPHAPVNPYNEPVQLLACYFLQENKGV